LAVSNAYKAYTATPADAVSGASKQHKQKED